METITVPKGELNNLVEANEAISYEKAERCFTC